MLLGFPQRLHRTAIPVPAKLIPHGTHCPRHSDPTPPSHIHPTRPQPATAATKKSYAELLGTYHHARTYNHTSACSAI